MSRLSNDEIREGRVWNGFDYQLQVWVQEGIVLRGRKAVQLGIVGEMIEDLEGAEVRGEGHEG